MSKTSILALAVSGLCFMAVPPVMADVQLLRTVGSFGGGDGQFLDPCGIAVDSSGNIWATDNVNDRVQEFSASGQFIWGFGTCGSGDGQFHSPRGIAVDPSGNVWVADEGNNRIQRLSSTGQFIQAIDTGFPRGLAVDPSGNVWEADLIYGGRINKFSSSGDLLLTFGGVSQFDHPEGIAVDSTGNVFVADKSGRRIQKFSSDGQLLQTLGKASPSSDCDVGLAVDSSGNIWVSAPIFPSETDSDNLVYEFSTSGVVLYPSVQPYCTDPRGLAFDASGHLWVADVGTNRLVEFSVPEPGTLSLLALGGLALLRRKKDRHWGLGTGQWRSEALRSRQ